MISIDLWRVRIGRFCGGAWYSVLKTARPHVTEKYGCDDVLLLYFSLCFMAYVGQCLGNTVLSSVRDPFANHNISIVGTLPLLGNDTFASGSVSSQYDVMQWQSWPFASASPSDIPRGFLLVVNCVLAVWRVWLSGDVEKNPGPPKQQDTLDTQWKQQLDRKIDKLFSALDNQASVMARIEKAQQDVKKEIVDLRESVGKDVDTMNSKIEKLTETVESMEDEIDRLESFSRRNNVKIYGLAEKKGEHCENVVRGLLTKYIPGVKWSDDVVERAHRLGKFNTSKSNNKPRPMIVKFQRWGEAMSLMAAKEGRDHMFQDGLRVVQDLTHRQQTRLRELREDGKKGYYKKGRLHISDESPPLPHDSTHLASHPRSPIKTGVSQPLSSDVTGGSGQPTAAERRNSGVGDSGAARGPITRSLSSAASCDRQPSLHEAWGMRSDGSS